MQVLFPICLHSSPPWSSPIKRLVGFFRPLPRDLHLCTHHLRQLQNAGKAACNSVWNKRELSKELSNGSTTSVHPLSSPGTVLPRVEDRIQPRPSTPPPNPQHPTPEKIKSEISSFVPSFLLAWWMSLTCWERISVRMSSGMFSLHLHLATRWHTPGWQKNQ